LTGTRVVPGRDAQSTDSQPSMFISQENKA
jgi:hypothetical protein